MRHLLDKDEGRGSQSHPHFDGGGRHQQQQDVAWSGMGENKRVFIKVETRIHHAAVSMLLYQKTLLILFSYRIY